MFYVSNTQLIIEMFFLVIQGNSNSHEVSVRCQSSQNTFITQDHYRLSFYCNKDVYTHFISQKFWVSLNFRKLCHTSSSKLTWNVSEGFGIKVRKNKFYYGSGCLWRSFHETCPYLKKILFYSWDLFSFRYMLTNHMGKDY